MNRVTEPGGSLEGALELAERIARNGPLAVAATKAIVAAARDWRADEGVRSSVRNPPTGVRVTGRARGCDCVRREASTRVAGQVGRFHHEMEPDVSSLTELSDVVRLVTGGAGGLGEAVVRKLHREGSAVVIADLADERAESLAEELGDRVVYVRTDVTSEDSVDSAIDDRL